MDHWYLPFWIPVAAAANEVEHWRPRREKERNVIVKYAERFDRHATSRAAILNLRIGYVMIRRLPLAKSRATKQAALGNNRREILPVRHMANWRRDRHCDGHGRPPNN